MTEGAAGGARASGPGRAAWLLALAAPALLSPRAARANPYDTLGYDAESSALLNSNVSVGRTVGVLYTNPALLPDAPAQVEMGLLLVTPRLHVHLAPRPRSAGVPLSIYDSNIGVAQGLQDRALPTVELPNRRGDTDTSGTQAHLGVGAVTALGQDAHLGLLLILPVSQGGAADIGTHYDDEREGAFSNRLYLMRFGQWDSVVSANLGLGVRISPWLSLGLSGQLAAAAAARIGVFIPDANVQDYSQSTLHTQVTIKMRPIAGLKFTPAGGLSIGLTFRGESYFKVDAESDVTLWNYHEASADKTVPRRTTQTIPVVFGYEPLELALGLGAQRGPLTAQIAATFQRYSRYLDGHAEHPEDAAGFPPSPFPHGAVSAADFRFRDVVAAGASVQLRYAAAAEISLGGAYLPTPVPAQVGRTSFVDNDLVGLGVGHRLDWSFFGRSFALTVAFQFWSMLARTTYKDPGKLVDEFPDSARTLKSNAPMPEAKGLQTNSPGFPGYQAGGQLFAAHLSLATAF